MTKLIRFFINFFYLIMLFGTFQKSIGQKPSVIKKSSQFGIQNNMTSEIDLFYTCSEKKMTSEEDDQANDGNNNEFVMDSYFDNDDDNNKDNFLMKFIDDNYCNENPVSNDNIEGQQNKKENDHNSMSNNNDSVAEPKYNFSNKMLIKELERKDQELELQRQHIKKLEDKINEKTKKFDKQMLVGQQHGNDYNRKKLQEKKFRELISEKTNCINLLTVKCDLWKKKYTDIKNDFSKTCKTCNKTRERAKKSNEDWIALSKYLLANPKCTKPIAAHNKHQLKKSLQNKLEDNKKNDKSMSAHRSAKKDKDMDKNVLKDRLQGLETKTDIILKLISDFNDSKQISKKEKSEKKIAGNGGRANKTVPEKLQKNCSKS